MLRIIILTIVIFILVFAGVYYWFFGRTLTLRRTVLTLHGHAFNIEIADTTAARAQGLSYRTSLAGDAGMLFKFTFMSRDGFWMKDMNFPIDILWFNGGKLVDITKNAQPLPGKSLLQLPIYYPSQPVDSVLEINAGLSDKYGFTLGDTYQITTEQ